MKYVITSWYRGKTPFIEYKYNTLFIAQQDLREYLRIHYSREQFHRGPEEGEDISGWYDADGDLLITDAEINSDNFRSFSLKNRMWEIRECAFGIKIVTINIAKDQYPNAAYQLKDYLFREGFYDEKEAQEFIKKNQPCRDCIGYEWSIIKGQEKVSNGVKWL